MDGFSYSRAPDPLRRAVVVAFALAAADRRVAARLRRRLAA
jgi:hypothetical protein